MRDRDSWMKAKVVLVGTGRLGSQLGPRLLACGHELAGLYGRNAETLQRLARSWEVPALPSLNSLPEADLLILAVSDDALPEVAARCKAFRGLVVHCSGATPASVLKVHFTHFGVLYPLQSFTPGRKADFEEIPLCFDASAPPAVEWLGQFAKTLGPKVFRLNDEQRLRLHLAAVFVNNFANHLFRIAWEVLEAERLPFHLLFPLMRETVERLTTISPHEAQTGPAVRNDLRTINRHLALLEDHPEWKALYQILTRSIAQNHKPLERTPPD